MENKKIQSAYLDEKVIFTMIITALLGLVITGFQYKNYEHCFAFHVRAKAAYFRTDEPIHFETDAQNTSAFNWDFGDNEQTETNINSAVHSYNLPGEYTVAVTINGTCTEYRTLYISKSQKLENPLLQPQFVCPQTAEVGKPVSFQDTTEGAHSWEWRFGETASVDATSSTATYTYKTPGLKTISLVINGNPHQMGVCKVFVNDKVIAPPKDSPRGAGRTRSGVIIVPAKPKSPSLEDQKKEEQPGLNESAKPQGVTISKKEFETKLKGVVNDLLSASDFSPYLCNNLNIPVSLNGQEITFTQFCHKLASIKNDKKIKQLNVQQIRDGETNCIIGLNVNLKMKQGILGIFK